MNQLTSEVAGKNLLDENSAAAILSVTPGTLAVWRCTGRYNLPYIKIGRKVRYRQTDLDTWIENRTQVRSMGANNE